MSSRTAGDSFAVRFGTPTRSNQVERLSHNLATTIARLEFIELQRKRLEAERDHLLREIRTHLRGYDNGDAA